MKPIADILEDAARLIEKPGAWIQGALAGDRRGWPLRGASTGADFCAHCWCVYGALQKAGWLKARADEKALGVSLISYHREIPAIASHLAESIGLSSDIDELAAWNDAPERTQAEVVAALRQAATLARGDTA